MGVPGTDVKLAMRCPELAEETECMRGQTVDGERTEASDASDRIDDARVVGASRRVILEIQTCV